MRSVTNRDSEVGVVGAREGTHRKLLAEAAVRALQCSQISVALDEHGQPALRVAAHVSHVLISR